MQINQIHKQHQNYSIGFPGPQYIGINIELVYLDINFQNA